MKNPDLFAGSPEHVKKLAAEAKKAKRLKDRKAFMKRLQDDLARR
jgi:hypothetical protein